MASEEGSSGDPSDVEEDITSNKRKYKEMSELSKLFDVEADVSDDDNDDDEDDEDGEYDVMDGASDDNETSTTSKKKRRHNSKNGTTSDKGSDIDKDKSPKPSSKKRARKSPSASISKRAATSRIIMDDDEEEEDASSDIREDREELGSSGNATSVPPSSSKGPMAKKRTVVDSSDDDTDLILAANASSDFNRKDVVSSDSDHELDEEDIALVEDNLGYKIKRKRRLLRRDLSDDDDDDDYNKSKSMGDVNVKPNLPVKAASPSFEDVAPQKSSKHSSSSDKGSTSKGSKTKKMVEKTMAEKLFESSSDEEAVDGDGVDDGDDDIGGFIDNAGVVKQKDGRRIGRESQSNRRSVRHDDAFIGGDERMREVLDIFGDDFELDDLFAGNEGDDNLEEEEDEYEDDVEEVGLEAIKRRAERHRAHRRGAKGGGAGATMELLQKCFEPSVLEDRYMTSSDDVIRVTDIPERFQEQSKLDMQRHGLPSPSDWRCDDDELAEEAQWIYNNALGHQSFPAASYTAEALSVNVVGNVTNILRFLRNDLLEVPFIAQYRQEYVGPELSLDRLWTIYDWDLKWRHLRARKANMRKLFRELAETQKNAAENDETRKGFPTIQDSDLSLIDIVKTDSELNSVMNYFNVRWRDELTDFRNSNLPTGAVIRPMRRSFYSKCKLAGLMSLAKRLGISASEFGANVTGGYQRHAPSTESLSPQEIATQYITNEFPDVESVLKGARHMLAQNIGCDISVRNVGRQIFLDHVMITTTPTVKGREVIVDFHEFSAFKYVTHKPVRKFAGSHRFLEILKAEADGLITITFHLDRNTAIDEKESLSYPLKIPPFNEWSSLYLENAHHNIASQWNRQRELILHTALTLSLFPAWERELRLLLANLARDVVVSKCAMKFDVIAGMLPPQKPRVATVDDDEEEEFPEERGPRVLACSVGSDDGIPTFMAYLDGNGEILDHLRLGFLLNRSIQEADVDAGLLAKASESRRRDHKRKMADMETLRRFITQKRPHYICVGAESMNSEKLFIELENLARSIADDDSHQEGEAVEAVQVHYACPEAARIFSLSERGKSEFPEYPDHLRRAVSLGRSFIDPFTEYASLAWSDEELLWLKLHRLQSLVPARDLIIALQRVMLRIGNLECGIDLNHCVAHRHASSALAFVCGLGRRKARALVAGINAKLMGRVENRQQLITKRLMGERVFINSSGFLIVRLRLSIDAASERNYSHVDVLDVSRVHPESYELARKIAVDALEYAGDASDAEATRAVEELVEADRHRKAELLKLNLEAYAAELLSRGGGLKQATLVMIRDELLKGLYHDLRLRRIPLKDDRDTLFTLLTGESDETLPEAMLLTVRVMRVDRERVICRLESGLVGIIMNRNLSDTYHEMGDQFTCESFTTPGDVITCRLISFNKERFSCDLSSTSSVLANRVRPYLDEAYDLDREHKDDVAEAQQKKKESAPRARQIAHPNFHNVNWLNAEKLLENADYGDVVIRPSKKPSHLNFTWKVYDGFCAHFDVLEENKPSDFSLGRTLVVDGERYDDLDEIIARYVHPLCSNALSIISHKNYLYGNKQELDEIMKKDKLANPMRMPYYFSLMKDVPGRFMLAYADKRRQYHEYITPTNAGFNFRKKEFMDLDQLLGWFKQNYNVRGKMRPKSPCTPPTATTEPPPIENPAPQQYAPVSAVVSTASAQRQEQKIQELQPQYNVPMHGAAPILHQQWQPPQEQPPYDDRMMHQQQQPPPSHWQQHPPPQGWQQQQQVWQQRQQPPWQQGGPPQQWQQNEPENIPQRPPQQGWRRQHDPWTQQ